MSFEYSFTRDEYLKANAKYMRRYTALILTLAIIYAVLTVAFLVVAIIDTFVYKEPIYDEKVAYQIYIMAFLTVIFSRWRSVCVIPSKKPIKTSLTTTTKTACSVTEWS